MSEAQNNSPRQTRIFKKGDIICTAGEYDNSLYMIHSGKLLVFVNDKTKITPLAYLNKGEYFGELGFFDRRPHRTHVISVEDTILIEIPITEIQNAFPPWLLTIAQSLTAKIRKGSELIQEKGIRKKKDARTIAPLSIEEQRLYYQSLRNYRQEN